MRGSTPAAFSSKQRARIQPEDTAATLAPRLAQTGAELMISSLAGLKCNNLAPRAEDDSQATLAPILTT